MGLFLTLFVGGQMFRNPCRNVTLTFGLYNDPVLLIFFFFSVLKREDFQIFH